MPINLIDWLSILDSHIISRNSGNDESGLVLTNNEYKRLLSR